MLTQNFDDQMTLDEVAQNLAGEYELLVQCDWFKMKFNNHAKNLAVTTLPGMMHFVFEMLLLSESYILMLQHFISTIPPQYSAYYTEV